MEFILVRGEGRGVSTEKSIYLIGENYWEYSYSSRKLLTIILCFVSVGILSWTNVVIGYVESFTLDLNFV